MSTGDSDIPVSSGMGRSFMVTNGRTRSSDGDLVALETVVRPTQRGHSVAHGLDFERRRVVVEVTTPASVAEISARFKIPMLTAQLLISELMAEDLYEATAVPVESNEVDAGLLLRIREKIATL